MQKKEKRDPSESDRTESSATLLHAHWPGSTPATWGCFSSAAEIFRDAFARLQPDPVTNSG